RADSGIYSGQSPMKRGLLTAIAFMALCFNATAYEQATHALITQSAYSRSVLGTGEESLSSDLGIASFWNTIANSSYFDVIQSGTSGPDAISHTWQDYENSMLDKLRLPADSSPKAWLL